MYSTPVLISTEPLQARLTNHLLYMITQLLYNMNIPIRILRTKSFQQGSKYEERARRIKTFDSGVEDAKAEPVEVVVYGRQVVHVEHHRRAAASSAAVWGLHARRR